MREILFRGKRTDNGEWIEGYLDANSTTKLVFIRTPREIYTDVNMVDPSTIGQYTGLKDKNSKRIFEGDILRSGYICVVKYGEFNCACCDGVYGWYFDGGDIRLCELYEVIGNIHDNPELIGERQ